MATEHVSIPEDGLHEPKGVSLAAADLVYVSDGLGSGSWSKISGDSLQGTITDSSASGLRLTTDGSGGITAEEPPGSSFGTMNLTDNSTVQAVTAAVDSTLQTNTDYVAITPAVTYEALQGLTTGSNSLIVDKSGLYVVDFWCNVKAATNGTLFGIKFVSNGTTFVARAPKEIMPNANSLHNIAANGIHTFTAGDEVKMYIASSTSTDITIESMAFQLLYIGSFV